MRMFRAYDIRGIYGKDITPESFFALGKAFTAGRFSKKLVAGMDYRRNNDILASALLDGFDGEEVFMGHAPTPAIVYNTLQLGVSLTASHNPPEYNGLKPFTKKRSFYSDELSALKKEFEKQPASGAGKFSGKIPVVDAAPVEAYKNALPECSNGVYDLAGGAVCAIASVFPKTIFSQPDPAYVRHSPEPTPEALGPLIAETRKNPSLGFAFDGDGDRCAVVDSGKLVDSGVVAAFYASNYLKKNSKVVLTLDVQDEVFTFLQNAGFKPFYSPVGDVFVLKKAEELGAQFAAEKGGHYSDFKHMPYSDGVYVSAVLSQVKPGELNEFARQFKNVFLSDQLPDITVDFAKLAQLLQEQNPLRIETIDGIKAQFDDYSVLIRPSNTQPIVRVSIEAKDRERGMGGLTLAKQMILQCTA